MCYNVLIEYSMDYFIRTVAEMNNEILEFGKFIRYKRMGMKPYLSLRKFAELCNISFTYLSDIEVGRVPAPSSEVLDRMARLCLARLLCFLRLKKLPQILAKKSKGASFLCSYIRLSQYAHLRKFGF